MEIMPQTPKQFTFTEIAIILKEKLTYEVDGYTLTLFSNQDGSYKIKIDVGEEYDEEFDASHDLAKSIEFVVNKHAKK